tara:strand:- start:143 stop:853 length:711 start_codon:yes stop_codon:yes gene_type:complete
MNLPLVNTAKHTVTLPGCGMDVEYRPFFVKEQKVLLQATESEDPAQITSATNDMIKACTFEKVDVEDLTSTDIEYLLLKIRAKSVGETAKIQLKCQHCEHPNEYEIDLDAIEPTGSKEKEQKIKINESIGVCFKLPTVGGLKKFMQVSGGTATDTLIATMGASVEYVYDADAVYPSKDQTPEEVIQFLESLSTEQFRNIQSAFDNFPRLRHDVKFKCTKCGEENSLELGGLGDFLG